MCMYCAWCGQYTWSARVWGPCPTYSDQSLIQVSSTLVEERKIDNELDMHKHWQLSQCACAGNHISAAGQGHSVGLTDSLINQGHHRLPRYMSQSASSSSLASTVSPSLRPGQHQIMQNMGQRRSRFSF